jgi:adenylyltransferase/sulfurtransferase
MFADDKLELYQKHYLLPSWSQKLQSKIAHSHVLVIGAGGLGCHVLPLLVRAGFGELTIIDGDHIDISNIPRQQLYNIDDVADYKALVALKKLRGIAMPDVKIRAYVKTINHINDLWLYQDTVDIVVDCSDNFITRHIINKFAINNNIPLVSAAVVGEAWWQATFYGFDENQPCYGCLFPKAIPPAKANCDEMGVLNTFVAMAASFQANAVFNVIKAQLSGGIDKTIYHSYQNHSMKRLIINKDANCSSCQPSHDHKIAKSE